MPAQYHYVYILRSVQHPEHHYTGTTSDLNARLLKHNEGGCPHTSKFDLGVERRPYKEDAETQSKGVLSIIFREFSVFR